MSLELDKCCFCIDLRSGCLIIGYLHLIGNIVMILMGIVALAAAGVVTAEGDTQEEQETGAMALGVIGVLLVFLILFLAFNIVLLVGLHKHKRGHVKAYMIYALIFVVLSIIVFFARFGGPVTVGGIIKDLFTIPVSTYSLLVIRSYYLKMNDPANKPAIYNKA